ncbi:hypothetical protein [Pedobacter sp.]
MYWEYTTKEENKISFYLYADPEMTKMIGMAEGYIGHHSELITVIKVTNEYQKQGFGFKLFLEVFEHLSEINDIKTVIGSWSKDDEFSYCEKGQSTNLSLFQEFKKKGLTDSEAAFSTPTGKWAKQIGYNKATFGNIQVHNVEVFFTKEP